MISELIAVTQSIKALRELLNAANDFKKSPERVAALEEVSAKLVEANEAALIAQEKQASLAHRVTELEKEIAEMERWDNESQRYELTTIAPGVFAYRMKPSDQTGEPPHMLCANCYAKRQKSILQLDRDGLLSKAYKCHNCSSELVVPTGREPPPPAPPYDPLNHW